MVSLPLTRGARVKKNAVLIVGVLSFLGLSACSKSDTSSSRQLSNDFFVTVLAQGEQLVGRAPAQTIETRADCEANLTQAVCETTATTDQISRNYNSIKCASNGAQYVPALMAIYDEMPDRMRPSLCSLDHIFLSDGIASTAFASPVTDSLGHHVGGYVGMRQATFLQQPTTHDLVTWKEQLAFDGSTNFLSNDPKLVQISYGLKLSTLPSDGLYYVLMHELGHLIDFGNTINSPGGLSDWSRLSWESPNTPLADATYFKRDDFCFYNCTQYLNPSDAKEIYTSLQKSSFITSYSSFNAWEDFAEFWAWRQMLELKSPNYEIVIPGEATLDMTAAIKTNPKIKRKLDFVTNLWNSPTLKVDNRAAP